MNSSRYQRLVIYRTLALGAGFFFSLLAFGVSVDLGPRSAALALPNAWLGISIFYLIPFLSAYLCSHVFCRLLSKGSLGIFLVMGSAAFSLMVGGLCVGAGVYSRCPLFDMCGTGDYLWFSFTAVIPALMGKLLVIRAWRGRQASPRRDFG